MQKPHITRKAKAAGEAHPGAFDVTQARLLTPEFFARDPRQVGPDLLGKLLLRREGRRMLAGRLVEVEAYLGHGDSAAHAAAGLTPRNRVLFGPPGHAYVYFIYGNHYCLNVSCLPEGEAGCILIRALEPLSGMEEMARRRGIELPPSSSPARLRLLATGPGRLAQAFGITRPRDNDKNMTASSSDLVLADDGFRPAQIAVTPRVGITKAAAEPLRYVIAGNEFLSRPSSAVGRGPRKLRS